MKKLIPLTLLPLLTLLALDATGQQSNPLRINCPPNQTNWHCGVASTAIVTYPAPTTTGSCPTNAVVTCTPPSGALFILGTTTVTCRATNSCRESVTCTFTVTVARDTTPPVIQCPTNRIVWLCSATATTATVSWPPPPASDNGDANVVVTCSPASGTFFSLGTTTVTCTATDDCTNRTTCTFTVTVARDTTPPVIQCPSNIVLQTCSPTGAVVNFPAPGATDNYDPMPAVVCTPPSGSAFPLGTNAVTCTATDDCTNRSTCTFTVTVRPPLLYDGLCHTPLGLAVLNVNPNGELEVSGPGTNGQDGVRIDLGESQGLRWRMKHPPGQPTGDMEVRVLGRTTTGTEVSLSRVFYEYRGARLFVRPGGASYGFKLLRQGQVVFEQSGRIGAFEIPPCHHVEQEHCVEWPDLNPAVSHCISFLSVECDWDTSIGPVRADTLVVTPEGPLPGGLDGLDGLVAITMIKTGAIPLTLHSERLLMFGSPTQAPLPHLALGQARLIAEDGALTMANLGSSGQDGVRVELGESSGLRWRMKNPVGNPEGDMDIDVIGRTTAGTEVPVRRISHQYRNGRLSVTPGTGSYVLKLLRQGQVVFLQGGRTGAVEIPSCQHAEIEVCVGEPFAGWSPLVPYCMSILTIECDWETTGGPVRADTLVLTPEDPLPPLTAISAVQILGRNIRNLPALTLLDERRLTFGGSELRLACPSNLTVRTCSTNPAPVTFPFPIVTGANCWAPPVVVCVPPSGSLFPPGTTTVQCTATNVCGQRGVCSFTITVIATLDYQLEGEPNNALGSAKDLGLAGFVAVTGRISPAGDVDFYRFTAVPNSRAWITVDTGGMAWFGANSRDSVLTLYNGAGAVIESDDNDGSGNGADSVLESGDASAIAGAALAGGAYYISVSAIGGGIIAPYRLYLTVTTNDIPPEVEANNTAATATTLIPPGLTYGVRSASLNPAGDEDWYTVSVPGPSLLHISADGDPERDGTGTDVVVELFRKDGVSILFSANSSAVGGAVAEGFVYRLSIPGTYYLRVRSATTAAATGTYRVMVAHCPLPPPPPLGIAHRSGRLTLSWPAALEPSLIRSSRDLRSWTYMDVTPVVDGDQLSVELPSSFPQQFFQLVPAGGWSNDSYHCCDANGDNCTTVHPNPHLNEQCDRIVFWCYETENSSVCEPQ